MVTSKPLSLPLPYNRGGKLQNPILLITTLTSKKEVQYFKDEHIGTFGFRQLCAGDWWKLPGVCPISTFYLKIRKKAG